MQFFNIFFNLLLLVFFSEVKQAFFLKGEIMADKNKNKIPDWVENLLYWSSVVLLLGQTYKKICNGEDLRKSLDITQGAEDVSNSK